MAKHYVDDNGRFVGTFDGPPVYEMDGEGLDARRVQTGYADSEPPEGGIEVPEPPPHADYYAWVDGQWIEDADRAEKQAERDMRSFEFEPTFKLLCAVLYDQDVRLCAQEGRPALPRAEFRQSLVGLVRKFS